MKGFGSHKKSQNKKIKSSKEDNFKEQIINKALKSHSKGNITEATKYYQSCIKQGYKDFRVFSNYGLILIGLGKLKEAELSLRKAITLKPNFAGAHLNLGNILKALGKFEEAELSIRKAIALKPDYSKAYYNLGVLFKDLGRLQEAELSIRKAIEINSNYVEAHSNLGVLFKDLGRLQEAELSIRRAIELNPSFEEAHYNLAILLINLGRLQEAELSIRRAIELNPCLAMAYNALSLLKYSDDNQTWQNQLFSQNILNKKLPEEKVDIYFARANVLHKKKEYKNSSTNLQLANDLKLNIHPSNADNLINKTNILLMESETKGSIKIDSPDFPESIFIVGMPRSGSTLLESILSMRSDVYDLGEINILEESFLEFKKSKQDLNLAELYYQKVNNKTKLNITTNKWLYNYQYAGIIASQIFNAKIIHCYRNPLDNILSIYRAHFAKGNEYSSCLIDSANVYLDQEKIMKNYKNQFQSKIYNFNYDSLVRNPKQEIKSLISWLGWAWNESYLTPHLNARSISTRSNIEVRSPINSKSIGGWKNYKDMLKPAIEIITQTDKYQDLLL